MSQYVPQTDNPVGSHVLLIDPHAAVSALLACAEQRIQAAKKLLRCLSLISGHSHDPHDLSAVCEASSLLLQQGCDVLGDWRCGRPEPARWLRPSP